MWWLRKLLVLGGLAAGVAKVVSGGRGGSGGSSGPGGSGRPAPTGGPSSPTRSASVTPPRPERETAASSAPANAARSLVSVPALPDSDGSGDDVADVADVTPATSAGATSTGERTWADPMNGGGCPPGYPIKANEKSGIYHVPDGRFYQRTAADRCYATADGAEADGYRLAKA